MVRRQCAFRRPLIEWDEATWTLIAGWALTEGTATERFSLLGCEITFPRRRLPARRHGWPQIEIYGTSIVAGCQFLFQYECIGLATGRSSRPANGRLASSPNAELPVRQEIILGMRNRHLPHPHHTFPILCARQTSFRPDSADLCCGDALACYGKGL